MIRRSRARIMLVAALTALTVASVSAQRAQQPEGVFYYQPASSVFGTEAAWVNAAGLAVYNAAAIQLMAVHCDDNFGKDWGFALNRDRLAIARRTLHNPSGDDYVEYVFASGMSLSKTLHVGGSYRYFKDGPVDIHKRHQWNIGFMGDRRGKFRWGALFSNLNHSRDENGDRTETEQRYSLAYRPFGKRLTVAADMFLSTGMSIKDADWTYHAELASDNGLFLNGYADSDNNYQIGFRVNLLHNLLGAKSCLRDEGDYSHTTVFVGSTGMRQSSPLKPKRKRLALGIAGSVRENPPRPVFGPHRSSFASLLLSVYRAAEDNAVGEMSVSLSGLALGFGQAQELREAFEYFRAQGKAITCHVAYPNNISYYLASATDRVLIPPVSQLRLVGLRAELTFYAGTLDKIGVKADMLRIGDHKTAAEQWTRSAATPENRAQLDRALDDLYDQFVGAIAEGRGLAPDSVRTIVDNGPFTSEEALRYGLVDGLSFRDEWKEDLSGRMPEISFRRYLADTATNDGWPARPELALVVADGEISFGAGDVLPSGALKTTPRDMNQAFERAASNPNVEGIVFRVNSPGGAVTAGEEIIHACSRAAERKPLAVSMANVAASGGYYVSMPSERLFANPAVITGSIGIFGGKPDLSGLYDKIALGKELFTRGRYAGMMTWMRPFTADEREKYYSHLAAFYRHFLATVAENRKLTVDSVDALGQGRIFTGREALANGLVDEIGGLKPSLDYVADRAGLDDYTVAIYPEKRPWLDLPGRSLLGVLTSFILGRDPGVEKATAALGPVLADEGIYARMPFDITIE